MSVGFRAKNGQENGTITMAYMGTTTRIHSFIPSFGKQLRHADIVGHWFLHSYDQSRPQDRPYHRLTQLRNQSHTLSQALIVTVDPPPALPPPPPWCAIVIGITPFLQLQKGPAATQFSSSCTEARAGIRHL